MNSLWMNYALRTITKDCESMKLKLYVHVDSSSWHTTPSCSLSAFFIFLNSIHDTDKYSSIFDQFKNLPKTKNTSFLIQYLLTWDFISRCSIFRSWMCFMAKQICTNQFQIYKNTHTHACKRIQAHTHTYAQSSSSWKLKIQSLILFLDIKTMK